MESAGKYFDQNMFSDPILHLYGANVLLWVWAYKLKDNKPKARGTCNRGKRYGQAVTLAETYATCVKQPVSRLFWALVAAECMIALDANAGNAFAEASPTKDPFYMTIDDQFAGWCVERKGFAPIPAGHVLPINHALQGHPEAPRLWEKFINYFLVEKLGFTAIIHERCHERFNQREPHSYYLLM